MEITFLGTSSMVPTKDRNQPAVFLRYGTEGILFDCGEGTQRQFKKAGIKLTAVTKILVSHWHGDHVLGLPGLIQTLSAAEYDKTLELYGPIGTKKRVDHLFEAFDFDRNINLKVHEVKPGRFFENDDYSLEALELDHGVRTLGFAFVEKDRRRIDMRKLRPYGLKSGPQIGKLQRGEIVTHKKQTIKPEDVSSLEKGKKVAYVTDTRLCDACYALAQNADVLISEATYTSALSNKSEAYNHMTAAQAGEVAASSGVGKLVLFHFSARYKKTGELEEDARKHFEDVVCADDLLTLKL